MQAMRFAIALLAQALAVSTASLAAVQLLPAGSFSGRGHEAGGQPIVWSLTDAQGQALAAKLNARHAQTDFSFDYDHQAFRSEQNGQLAPASGWASTFEWRAGLGLFATDVRWTARAMALIDGLEYRYISPAIKHNPKTGEVLDVLNAALLNIPALDLDPITLARLSASFYPEPPMNLAQQLIAALGLPADTSETTLLTAVAALQARSTAVPAPAPAAGPDVATLAAMQAVQGQVATLQAQLNERTVSDLVSTALAAGKLLPAQKEWAIGLGKTNLTLLAAYLDTAPAVAAGLGAGQSTAAGTSAAGANANGTLDASQLALCGVMGIAPEAFAKQLALKAA